MEPTPESSPVGGTRLEPQPGPLWAASTRNPTVHHHTRCPIAIQMSGRSRPKSRFAAFPSITLEGYCNVRTEGTQGRRARKDVVSAGERHPGAVVHFG